jgi:hypothetical protein
VVPGTISIRASEKSLSVSGKNCLGSAYMENTVIASAPTPTPIIHTR